MARVIPYAYRPGNTALHRCPGTLKLLGLLGFSGAAFSFGGPALGAATCALIALSLLAGVKPWELIRGSAPLAVMILSILGFRSLRPGGDGGVTFNPEGAGEALFFGWRILLSFSAGALLFSVTTMMELKDSLEMVETALFRPLVFLLKKCPLSAVRGLARRLERPRLSLALSLMLAFLPRFFEAWEAANLAWKARGGKPGIRLIAALIPLVTERMMETASETAQALEARGFT